MQIKSHQSGQDADHAQGGGIARCEPKAIPALPKGGHEPGEVVADGAHHGCRVPRGAGVVLRGARGVSTGATSSVVDFFSSSTLPPLMNTCASEVVPGGGTRF